MYGVTMDTLTRRVHNEQSTGLPADWQHAQPRDRHDTGQRSFTPRHAMRVRALHVFSTLLTELYSCVEEQPTLYVSEKNDKVVASYRQGEPMLIFHVLKEALRVSLKRGSRRELICPSTQEAVRFMIELEGARQKTKEPVLRLATRHAQSEFFRSLKA